MYGRPRRGALDWTWVDEELRRAGVYWIASGGDVDVVIVDGRMSGPSDDPVTVADDDAEDDWDYRIHLYVAFTVIEPEEVMAWRSAGEAGRKGFRATGKWRFGNP